MSASHSEDESEEESIGEVGPATAEVIEDNSDNEGGDEVMKEPIELTNEEENMMKEIQYDDDDVEDYLKNSENTNTRRQTENTINKYNKVMSFIFKKEGNDFVPLENTDIEEIPKRLSRFFKLVRTKKGEVFNASTYTSFLCCFTRYLADVFNPPIDVKNDARFKIVRTMVKRMKAQAQAVKGKKPGDNASKVVAPRHLRLAWVSGSLGREDPDSLTATTYVVTTVGFGCRSVEEVRRISNGALVWGKKDPKTNVYETVRLDEHWVSKNRAGDHPRIMEAQITADHENPQTCMVRTLMAFMARKTDFQCAPDNPLFWSINQAARQKPETHQKWFKKQPMGKNTIRKLFTDALTRAGVNCEAERYTASSSRKVMLDGALDSNIPEVLVGKLAGQRSNHAKSSYIEMKDTTHRAANIALSRVGAGLEADYKEILSKVIESDKKILEQAKSERKFEDSEESSNSDEDEYVHTVSQSRIISEFGSVDVHIEQEKKRRKIQNQQKIEKNLSEQQNIQQLMLRQQLQIQQQQMVIASQQQLNLGSLGQQQLSLGGLEQQQLGFGGLGQHQLNLGSLGQHHLGLGGLEQQQLGFGGLGQQHLNLGSLGQQQLGLGGLGQQQLRVLGRQQLSLWGLGQQQLHLGGLGQQQLGLRGLGLQQFGLGDLGQQELDLGGLGQQQLHLGGLGQQQLHLGGLGQQQVGLGQHQLSLGGVGHQQVGLGILGQQKQLSPGGLTRIQGLGGQQPLTLAKQQHFGLDRQQSLELGEQQHLGLGDQEDIGPGAQLLGQGEHSLGQQRKRLKGLSRAQGRAGQQQLQLESSGWQQQGSEGQSSSRGAPLQPIQSTSSGITR